MSSRRSKPKIGVIVDGEAEWKALHLIPWGFDEQSMQLLVRRPPDFQPKASLAKQARSCAPAIQELGGRPGMRRVIVIVDREDRIERPQALARALLGELVKSLGLLPVDVHVVVKDIAFENWLYADYEAFSACTARFHAPSKAQSRPTAQVDGRNVKPELERLCRQASYDKVKDAVRLAPYISPDRAAQRSESFGMFHRLLLG